MKRLLIFCLLALCVSGIAAQETPQPRFVDATTLNIIGKGLPTEQPYHRIDTTRYKGFSKSENQQVRCSAGLAVVFTTNSSRIDVWPTYRYEHRSDNCPGIADAGFDLYIRRDGQWLYAASLAPKKRGESLKLIENMDSTTKECLLYLPQYSELGSLQVGIDPDATIRPMENPFRHKVMIFGSSFTHGISTSRAGMAYPMQIERNTGIYFCSIACSGNSKLQPYFANYLSDVKDADAFVFDGFSNPQAPMIEERLIPFIARLRAAVPGKPLIFVQTIYRERRNFDQRTDAIESAKMETARRIMAQAVKQFSDVYFIDSPALTGSDHVTSADGTHPSDLGYWRWAQNLQPELLKIFRKYGIQ